MWSRLFSLCGSQFSGDSKLVCTSEGESVHAGAGEVSALPEAGSPLFRNGAGLWPAECSQVRPPRLSLACSWQPPFLKIAERGERGVQAVRDRLFSRVVCEQHGGAGGGSDDHQPDCGLHLRAQAGQRHVGAHLCKHCKLPAVVSRAGVCAGRCRRQQWHRSLHARLPRHHVCHRLRPGALAPLLITLPASSTLQ